MKNETALNPLKIDETRNPEMLEKYNNTRQELSQVTSERDMLIQKDMEWQEGFKMLLSSLTVKPGVFLPVLFHALSSFTHFQSTDQFPIQISHFPSNITFHRK